MKKVLIGLLFLAVAFTACAQQEILYRDTFTILWDAPEPYPELLTGETVSYRVYMWDMAQGAPTTSMGVGWVYEGETALLELGIVIPVINRREYAVGIMTVVTKADLTEVTSDLANTTVLADIDIAGVPGVPFVYAPDSGLIPSKPKALKDSGI